MNCCKGLKKGEREAKDEIDQKEQRTKELFFINLYKGSKNANIFVN